VTRPILSDALMPALNPSNPTILQMAFKARRQHNRHSRPHLLLMLCHYEGE
jgi:hypothetical protein